MFDLMFYFAAHVGLHRVLLGEVIYIPSYGGNGWVGNPINPGPMAKFLFCPKQKNPHGRKVGVVEILSTKN